ncbi:anti-sigma factor [Mycolicibacterium wolinskyi]|uniref:anti-sigma factor n=1 Tax=Mycolicibacterium wolinskyi TaxID=59750 RepID=UPI003917B0CC
MLHAKRLPRGTVDHTHPHDTLEFRVPARMDRLSTVRTVLAALAAFDDLDLDAVADLRLAVDEACAVLIDSAAPGSLLTLVVEPHRDALVIHASTPRSDAEIPALGGFSRHVLSALIDDVRTFHAGQVFGISLTTRRRWASAN